jgi:regulator of cell morphogenesis and NO signaling
MRIKRIVAWHEEEQDMADDNLHKSIAEFVTEDYRTAEVLDKHGIDFCCGGQTTLADACREQNVEPDLLLREIEEIRNQPGPRSENYSAWEPPFLADYIVNTHHAWINDNIHQISAHTRRVAEVHGSRHPEVIEIAKLFNQVATDMVGHLREEEDVLFPALKRVHARLKRGVEPASKDHDLIQNSLEKLYREHEEVGAAIHRIRHLSKDYQVDEKLFELNR